MGRQLILQRNQRRQWNCDEDALVEHVGVLPLGDGELIARVEVQLRHVFSVSVPAGLLRCGLAAGLLVSLPIALDGCTTSAVSVQSGQETQATSGESEGVANAVGDDLLASANALSAADASGTVLSSAAARLTLVVQGTSSTTMTIRDEDGSTFAPGRYELRTYCAGTGVLSANVIIGDASGGVAQMPECTPQGAVGTVSIDVEKESSPAVITITPAEGALAAVAYQLRLSPQ